MIRRRIDLSAAIIIVRHLLLVLLFFSPPAQSRRQENSARHTKLSYGCNGYLLCDHGVVERNRISSLQSHRKALEKECCIPDVLRDSGDMPIIIIILIIIFYTPGSKDPRG